MDHGERIRQHADGRRFRTFSVLDEANREALGIEVGTSIPTTRVVRVLDQRVELFGRPQAVRLDNGPELTAKTFTAWCRTNRSTGASSSPASPTNTPSSRASIGRTGRRCSMLTSSIRSSPA
jgi:transposase InsO family protein